MASKFCVPFLVLLSFIASSQFAVTFSSNKANGYVSTILVKKKELLSNLVVVVLVAF